MIWIKDAILSLICLVILVLIGHSLALTATTNRQLNLQQKEKIVELYELRVKSAETTLKIDQLALSKKKKIFEKAKTLIANGSISDIAYEEVVFGFKQAELEVEITSNLLLEAKLFLEIIKNSTDSWNINFDDIKLSRKSKEKK